MRKKRSRYKNFLRSFRWPHRPTSPLPMRPFAGSPIRPIIFLLVLTALLVGCAAKEVPKKKIMPKVPPAIPGEGRKMPMSEAVTYTSFYIPTVDGLPPGTKLSYALVDTAAPIGSRWISQVFSDKTILTFNPSSEELTFIKDRYPRGKKIKLDKYEALLYREKGKSTIVWWVTSGLTLTLSGSYSPDKLLAIAKSVK